MEKVTERGIRRNQVSLWPLVMAIFFCASGGPFGLEGLIQESGPAVAILLVLITPIFWGAPVALLTAELASALPCEGGYYVWVKRAFGPFAAFQCAWWTWVYSWIDVAIYPVQFTQYLGDAASLLHVPHPWGDDQPWAKWALGLLVIIPCTWLNIRGARPVGKTALTLGLLALSPFVLMVLIGIQRVKGIPALPSDPAVLHHAIGSGLFLVMWNYQGWDCMSTIAEEVERPHIIFPKALAIAMAIIVASYLLPILVGLVTSPDPSTWTDGSWPTIAMHLGGPALAAAVLIAAIMCQAGQFISNLLGISRVPMALAQDNRLPAFLGALHPKFRTPWVAILVSSAVYTILSYQSFQDLVKFDVLIYSFGLMIELSALLWLRKMEPNLPRPFKIPGGWPMLLLVVASPAIMVGFAILHSLQTEPHALYQSALLFGTLATGPLIYWLYRLSQAKSVSV